MPQTFFDEWVAARYERLWPELFAPGVRDPAVDFLAALAASGPCLELGVGTGRIAIPLSRRGLRVDGIELSTAMAARVPAADVRVTIGDFATTKLADRYALVFLLRNTITNLTTQDEQVEAFRNAAAHLEDRGHFVIENYVPAMRERVFTATGDHLGYETYDDAADQIAVSHHHWAIDGELRTFASPHRYVWPAELDLMARLAGLEKKERWADWHRTPFTASSPSHITVYQLRARS